MNNPYLNIMITAFVGPIAFTGDEVSGMFQRPFITLPIPEAFYKGKILISPKVKE
jgi:hypothetical protein